MDVNAGYGFASLSETLLPEPPSESFQNARFTSTVVVVVFSNSASDQVTHFGGKEIQQCAYDLGISWISCKHRPRAASLMEARNDLLKNWLRVRCCLWDDVYQLKQ